jgi:hypothetical protein
MMFNPQELQPTSSSASFPRTLAFLLAWLMAGWFSVAWGGASACSWIVVVNGDSVDSRTLANHFCQLRKIPHRNVIVLRSVPAGDQITVDEFRDTILGPVLKEIEARGLTPTIQGIVYSSDMPTAVQCQGDLNELKDRSKYLTPVASINGLTYMFRWVMTKNPSYIGFESNWYAAREASVLLNVFTGTPESRAELAKWIENRQYEDAAKRFDEMRSATANPFPLEFLAARQWALAGDTDKAIDRLAAAIRNGWRYRKEITNDPAFDALTENPRFQRLVTRCPNDDFRYLPTRGFDARSFYAPNTLESNKPDQGVTYLLSTVLSVTRDQGITPPEAIAHLERSALADYARPVGTFFFTKTGDVRTQAREPNFAIAVERLQGLKMNARVIEQALPSFGEKCIGVMFGLPVFDWARSGAVLLPGAIAENLTSLGGAMTSPAQTKATELLRHGAAASSGAVHEPYAIQNKFPHPMMYTHYAQGLTSAEAFYESILCPYQLLIVGDPLCQPFAEPPRFNMSGVRNLQSVSGTVELQLTTSDEEFTVDPVRMTWMVEGLPKNEVPFPRNVRIQVAEQDRGAMEWRIMAKGPKPLEHRYEQLLWVVCGDADSQITLDAPKQWTATEGAKLQVELKNPPAEGTIGIRHDWEIIAQQPANQPKFEIDPAAVGYGPVRLQGVILNGEGQVVQASLPVTITMTK